MAAARVERDSAHLEQEISQATALSLRLLADADELMTAGDVVRAVEQAHGPYVVAEMRRRLRDS